MNTKQPRKISRRAFLRSTTATIGGALLAACGPARGGEDVGERLALGPRATPQIVLPSPAPAENAATATPEPLLAAFLALSTLLTGVPHLSPGLGRVYLQSLQAGNDFEVTVVELIEQVGLHSEEPPNTLAALEASGIFEQAQTGDLANRITELWYTGIYTNEAGEDAVATYADALAWQTLRFTKPKTICGYPGFWAQAWRAPT